MYISLRSTTCTPNSTPKSRVPRLCPFLCVYHKDKDVFLWWIQILNKGGVTLISFVERNQELNFYHSTLLSWPKGLRWPTLDLRLDLKVILSISLLLRYYCFLCSYWHETRHPTECYRYRQSEKPFTRVYQRLIHLVYLKFSTSLIFLHRKVKTPYVNEGRSNFTHSWLPRRHDIPFYFVFIRYVPHLHSVRGDSRAGDSETFPNTTRCSLLPTRDRGENLRLLGL